MSFPLLKLTNRCEMLNGDGISVNLWAGLLHLLAVLLLIWCQNRLSSSFGGGANYMTVKI